MKNRTVTSDLLWPPENVDHYVFISVSFHHFHSPETENLCVSVEIECLFWYTPPLCPPPRWFSLWFGGQICPAAPGGPTSSPSPPHGALQLTLATHQAVSVRAAALPSPVTPRHLPPQQQLLHRQRDEAQHLRTTSSSTLQQRRPWQRSTDPQSENVLLLILLSQPGEAPPTDPQQRPRPSQFCEAAIIFQQTANGRLFSSSTSASLQTALIGQRLQRAVLRRRGSGATTAAQLPAQKTLIWKQQPRTQPCSAPTPFTVSILPAGRQTTTTSQRATWTQSR